MEKVREHDATRTYNVCDIQNILGISRTMAYKLVNSRQFRIVRVGNRILISKKSFDEWLDQGDVMIHSDVDAGSSDDNAAEEETKDKYPEDKVIPQTVLKEAPDSQNHNNSSDRDTDTSADMMMLLKLMQDPDAARMLKGLAGLATKA